MKFKIISLVICLILIVGISGCAELLSDNFNFTSTTIDKVKTTLEEKYSSEMFHTKIGSSKNTVTIYFYSHDNPNVTFTATFDKETGEIKDNYISRLIGYKVKKDIEQNFENQNIATAIDVSFYGKGFLNEPTTDMTIEQFLDEYSAESLFIYMAIDFEDIHLSTVQDIISILEDYYYKFSRDIVVSGYVISDNFDVCKSDMINEPEITKTWFNQYYPCREFNLSIIDGECSVSEATLRMDII